MHFTHRSTITTKNGTQENQKKEKNNNRELPQIRLTPDFQFMNQVSRIKERVEEKEGIPPVQQRLIFGGKQM